MKQAFKIIYKNAKVTGNYTKYNSVTQKLTNKNIDFSVWIVEADEDLKKYRL